MDVSTIVARIMEVFIQYVRRIDGDEFDVRGKEILYNKIKWFVERCLPVQLTLTAFPGKSPNRGKTLGHLPDGAELASFWHFMRFQNLVGQVYRPGGLINLVSDGEFFAPLVGIQDLHVKEYRRECRKMYGGVMWEIADFFPEMAVPEIVKLVVSQFGQSQEWLDTMICNDANIGLLYTNLMRFIQADLVFPPDKSKTKRIKEAKKVAREMIVTSEAFAGFIAAHFPHAVRISSHQSANNGTKYSWQFIPGCNDWRTPWHNCLCLTPECTTLAKRCDAERQGLELVYHQDRPYYFRTPGSGLVLEGLQ